MSDWETVGKSNDGWEDVSGWETVSPQKRKTTLLENFGIGINQGAQPLVKAGGLIAGGAATLLGDTETADSIYKGMEDLSSSMNEYWTPKDAEQSFGGKLQGTVMTLPVQMAGMIASPFETGQQAVKAGESVETAQKASAIDTAGNAIGLALPGYVGKTVLGKAATGAGINAAQDVATKSAISSMMETPEMKEMFAPTAESAAVSGIVGAGTGLLSKHEVRNAQIKTSKTPYDKTPKPDDTPTWEVVTDVQRTADTLRSKIKAIEEQKSRQERQDTPYYAKLEQDRLEAESQLIKLDTFLAKAQKDENAVQSLVDKLNQESIDRNAIETEQRLEKAAQNDVEAPRIDEQLQTEYSARQMELNSLESEYRSLASKGAALTNADRLRLEVVEKRHAEVSDYLESNLVKIEAIEAAKKERVKQRSETDFHALREQELTPTWELREPMVAAIKERGLRGGLEFLASKADDASLTKYGRYLGTLAKKLADNPLIKADTSFDPNFKHAGGYSNLTGEIKIRDEMDASPVVVLHEASHSAINKAIMAFEKGELTDPVQVKAVRGINSLYRDLRGKYREKLLKALGEENFKIMFENTREFVAYALSDQKLQLTLDKIKLGQQTAWGKLVTTFKDLMGLNKQERTALDDVLNYGETLIERSDGQAYGKDFDGDLYSPMRKVHTPTEAWRAIKNGSLHIFAHGFTQNLRQMMRDNPHFSALEKKISEAEIRRERAVRIASYGMDSKIDWLKAGKFFFKLSGAERSDAVVPAMYNMSNKEIVSTMDVLMDGYRNGVPIEETINKSTFTEKQANLARAVQKAVDVLWEEAVRMQGNNQLNPKLKQRIGYVLTSRTGDYAVTVTVAGIPVRMETFHTRGEAEHWKEWFAKQSGKDVVVTTDTVENLRANRNDKNLVEFLDEYYEQKDKKQFLQDTYDKLTSENSAIGSHSQQSSILSGFIGDQAGLTLDQRGERWRAGLPRAIHEYAQSIMNRDVQKNLIEWHLDNDHLMDKTTSELGDFYAKTQTGTPYTKDTFREALRDASQRFKEAIDSGVDNVFGYKHRDKHAFDRAMGLFSNAFYTANIIMKPSIWLAQPLQALTSVRSAFKEGESPRQVLSAFGETLLMLSSGKLAADKDFVNALYHVAQEGNVLHPQMTNEFNDMHFGTNPNSMLNKIIDMGTGKTISAAGDKFSRFASFVFFYNLHKRSGLKGKDLWNAAGRDATENMIAYGNKKLPAIYREMGLFGEQSAPLTTFAHTQMGNMIVDVKEFIKQPSARTSAPLILTAGLMMAMGGAISLPLVAEYELLRLAGMASGWWGNEWPSMTDIILKNTPTWVSHGVISDATGMDLDASMRYTSLLQKIGDVEKQGMLAFMPHLAWGKEVIANTPTVVSGMVGGNTTEAEFDQALKKVVPKGWMSGAVDAVRHDGDLFTKAGPRGGAGVERDTAAKVAPWLGVRTTKEAMDTQAVLIKKQRDEQEKKLLSRAAQFYASKDVVHGNAAMDRLLRDFYNGDRDKLERAINSQITDENLPMIYRAYTTNGNMTEDQQRQFIRDNMTTYLRKRNK